MTGGIAAAFYKLAALDRTKELQTRAAHALKRRSSVAKKRTRARTVFHECANAFANLRPDEKYRERKREKARERQRQENKGNIHSRLPYFVGYTLLPTRLSAIWLEKKVKEKRTTSAVTGKKFNIHCFLVELTGKKALNCGACI